MFLISIKNLLKNSNITLTVSFDLMEKMFASSVENPGDRQLCAINPNLSCERKGKT